MHSVEGASDLDLQSVDVRLLPTPQVVLNLHNGLQPFRRPLGEVVKALIVLIALHGVKPGKLISCGRAHSVLREQAKKSDHMGPPVGRYLEDSEPKLLKNLDEERVQREPHSKLEIALGQCCMADRKSMRPLQISRLDYLETIHPCYPVHSSDVIKDSRSPQLTTTSSALSST